MSASGRMHCLTAASCAELSFFARYAAKQRAALGLAPEEEDLPLSGIADRPYCKGRAYKPDRYGRNTFDAGR